MVADQERTPMAEQQQDQQDRIEREIHVAASPDVVFEVVSSPEHLVEWWPDEAVIEPTPGFEGELVFGDRSSPDVQIPKVTVVDAVPGRLFSFRWLYPSDEAARPDNSLLVTFTLEPADGGTLVRMVESGWQDKAWTAEQRAAQRRDNDGGWDHFIGRLGEYVARLAATS
jgi:uncharacterized protein YndB with AHSA1/START domain